VAWKIREEYKIVALYRLNEPFNEEYHASFLELYPEFFEEI
tara:strand:+ start:99 stop:221 length:123 start_codon:yes stop_codon:yes gene_type:complete